MRDLPAISTSRRYQACLGNGRATWGSSRKHAASMSKGGSGVHLSRSPFGRSGSERTAVPLGAPRRDGLGVVSVSIRMWFNLRP